MGPNPAPILILALLLLLWAPVDGQPRGRILRGSEAKPHLKPYMASLQLDGQHVCGGFLIAPQWVLSAAHCMEETDGKLFQVLLGAHSLTQPEPHKRLYRVRAQFPHPGSNIHNNKDDLLLLQLEEEAELNTDVRVLPFQREDRDVAADTVCEVAGWGTTDHSGTRPDKLQQLERPVISRDVCNHRTRHDGTITPNMMCTDSRRKDTCKQALGTVTPNMMCTDSCRKYTCKGDSGGPLVCGGVAEGVLTAGSRVCGNYKKPAIYTRIAPYADWIDSVMASAAHGEGDTR